MSRSFLFVPADSERKLAKARDGDADALIIDLNTAETDGDEGLTYKAVEGAQVGLGLLAHLGDSDLSLYVAQPYKKRVKQVLVE